MKILMFIGTVILAAYIATGAAILFGVIKTKVRK